MISHYKYSVIGFITAAVCLFWQVALKVMRSLTLTSICIVKQVDAALVFISWFPAIILRPDLFPYKRLTNGMWLQLRLCTD